MKSIRLSILGRPSHAYGALLTVLSCGTGAVACDAARDVGSGVSVVDSAGVEIVTNPWTGDWEVPEWTLAEEPEFSVGDPAPSPEYELHRVYYARSFPDGRVLVSMNLTECRVFSPEGEHLLTFGREGEGPGEFQFLWDAHPVGDSLIRTLGIGNRRTGLFDAHTGELISEGPLHGFSNPNGAVPLWDGTWAGLVRGELDEDPGTPEGFVVRFSLDGATADTIGPVFAAVPYRYIQPPGAPVPMFQGSIRSTAAGDHMWAGCQGEYAIRRWRSDGVVDRIVRLDYAGEPVTAQVRDSVTGVQPQVSEGGAPRQLDFPERFPPWNKLLATDSGWLWVRRNRTPFEDFMVYDIFDPEGRHAAYIRIPADARLSEVGDDHVLGVFSGTFDIEVVSRYRIRK